MVPACKCTQVSHGDSAGFRPLAAGVGGGGTVHDSMLKLQKCLWNDVNCAKITCLKNKQLHGNGHIKLTKWRFTSSFFPCIFSFSLVSTYYFKFTWAVVFGFVFFLALVSKSPWKVVLKDCFEHTKCCAEYNGDISDQWQRSSSQGLSNLAGLTESLCRH